jgi:hypothetical protein
MNTYNCPYCDKLCEIFGIGYPYAECFEHKNTIVTTIFKEDYSIFSVRFFSTTEKDLSILSLYLFNLTKISYNKKCIVFHFIDPNLTPENFEQKLKTYLTFK